MTPAVPADEVVGAMPLAAHVARRYRHRGEAADELEQVAYLALAEAAHRFDPARGRDFRAYAVAWVDGALRHHFRDRTWMVRPPRRLVEHRAAVAEGTEHGLSPDDVHRVRRLGSAYSPIAIDAVAGGLDALAWTPVRGAAPYDQVVDRADLAPALRLLDADERRVVLRRFRDDWTQAQIAAELGVSQMHVSRVLGRVLARLRAALAA